MDRAKEIIAFHSHMARNALLTRSINNYTWLIYLGARTASAAACPRVITERHVTHANGHYHLNSGR